MENHIDKIDDSIKSSDFKHLNAEYRNALLSKLTVDDATMVILNTLSKNRYLWSDKHESGYSFDSTILGLLKFIKGDIDRDQFVKENNKWLVYYENRINEGKYPLGYAGMALVKLGQEYLSQNFAVPDEMEEKSDPENWSSLFFGSLAFSNGAEDIENLDPEKNYTFWKSFLDNIKNKKFNYQKTPGSNRFSGSDGNVIPPDRKQFDFFNSQSTTKGFINNLQNKALQIREKYDAKSISLEFILINKSFSFLLSCDDKPIDNKEAYMLNIRLGLKPLITSIKKEMYASNPEEGAWLSSRFFIKEDDTLTADFNYDIKKGTFDEFVDVTDYKEELKVYPRELRFMPKWLIDRLVE